MDKTLHTKWGTAKLQKNGYYVITSCKDGNNGIKLHRLIAKDYFGDWIDEPLIDGERIEIHHIDGNPLNNCVLNLLPLPKGEHLSLHHKGKIGYWKDKHHSDDSRKKMSDAKKDFVPWNKGKHHSEETKKKMSEAASKRNTSGYLNVCKVKCKTCKKGYTWVYSYRDKNGKRERIHSTSFKKLKDKVKSKCLPWRKL